MSDKLGTWVELPIPRSEIDAAEAKVKALVEALKDFTVENEEDAETAGELLKEAHEEWKKWDKLRKEATKPARDAQKIINETFKPVLKGYEKAKALCKAGLEAWRQAEEAKRQAAMERVAQGDASALQDLVPTDQPAGVSYRRRVVVEVVDESKVPREYLMVNMAKLQALAQSGGEAPPGVVFRVEEVAVVGR